MNDPMKALREQIERVRNNIAAHYKSLPDEWHDWANEQIDGLNAALAALCGEQGWLPIETAPRDGRQLILLLTPSRFPQVAFSNSWWRCGFSVECKPTHWHPIEELPAAPAPKEGV